MAETDEGTWIPGDTEPYPEESWWLQNTEALEALIFATIPTVEHWTPSNRGSVPTSEGGFTAHAGTEVIANPGHAVDVHAQVEVHTTKGPAVGDTDITFRVRISLDGGSTWTSTETADSEASADVETAGARVIFASASGVPSGDIHVELSSRRNDGAGGTVNAIADGGRVDVLRAV